MSESTKQCLHCKEYKPISVFMRPDRPGIYSFCSRCESRKARARLKLDMLEAYGWKCACCGESHPWALSLDHINNDGAEHRAKFTGKNTGSRWIAEARREGWPKDKYQLLCMNCNVAKENYGECYHKQGISVEQAINELKSRLFKLGKRKDKLTKISEMVGLPREMVEEMIKKSGG